eukprot:6479851-Amphidinium_carterae.1
MGVALASELELTSMSFEEPPKCFVLLLLPDDDERHLAVLTYLQQLYTSLLSLESEASRTADVALKRWLRDLIWPTSSWCREVLETLRADGWQMRRPYIRKAIREYARCWRSTLIAENGNRLARVKELHATGKSSVLRLWQHLHTTEELTSEYGRASAPTCEARCAHQMDDAFFKPDLNASSLPHATVDKLLSTTPDFGTYTAKEFKLASLRTLSLWTLRDWGLITGAWWSRLLTPGCVVSRTDAEGVYLVLQSSAYGALVVQIAPARYQQSVVCFNLTSQPAMRPQLFAVQDPAKVKVLSAVLATPGSSYLQGLPAQSRQCVVVPTSKKAVPLLHWAVRGGFRGLSTPLLKDLLRRLQMRVAGASASTDAAADSSEETCIAHLVRLVLPDAGEDTVKEVMQARVSEPADAVLRKTPVDVASDLLVDSDCDDSDHDGQGDIDELADALAASQTRQLRLHHLRGADGTKRKRGAKSALAGAVVEGKSQIEFSIDKPMTAAQAQRYAPPDCRIVMENSDKYHRRWKASADYMQQMFTKTFHGRNENLQSNEALLLVLGKAWDAYSRKSGQPCPYVLELNL